MVFRVNELSHFYKKVRALDSITFSVKAGDRFAILGPNGSGKSTLMKLISALRAPQFGTISVLDRDFTAGKSFSNQEIRRAIGVIFQSPALDKKLTAYENMVHYGHLFGLMGQNLRQRISTLAGQFSLKELLNQAVEKLSGGLQRRVELAKALLPEPTILILDEPTTGLDPTARSEFWNLIEGTRASRPLTVLYSTHMFEEAIHADSVLLLNLGRVVALGEPNRLTEELGRDLLCAEVNDGGEVSRILTNDFGLKTLVRSGRVYADVSHKRDRIADIYRVLSEKTKVSIGRPELSDLFFIKTGVEESQATSC